MKKQLFLFFAISLLVISIANAQSFEVSLVPVKDKIAVDDVAEYDFIIQNHMETMEEFTIKKTGYPFWDMYTKPLQSPITIIIPAQSEGTMRIYVDPIYITSVDTYTLEPSVVLERTGFEQKVPLTIGIKSTDALISGYVPTVTATVSIMESIDPRQQFTIKITLNNQNVINYENLTVRAESSLFSEELHIALGPKEEKILEITKKLNDLAPPKSDKLVVSALMGDRIIINPIIKEFSIREYSSQTSLGEQRMFLKTVRGFEITSNNPYFEDEVKVSVPEFSNLVTSTSPKAKKIEESGKIYLVWNLKFDGQNSIKVYTTENYRPLVVIVLLSIGAVVLYFLLRSPIVVTKGVAGIGTSEGGISDAKVVVKVKNRSSQPINNIEVVDHAPHIAHVEKELTIGSMQPHSVLKHPKRGLIIKWTIESLEPGDERVLSYKMKSRLTILGEFNLPSASARCSVGKKVIISNSNRVSVGQH